MASGKLPHYVPAKRTWILVSCTTATLVVQTHCAQGGRGWASQVEGGGLPRWRDLEGGVGTFSEGHCLLQ